MDIIPVDRPMQSPQEHANLAKLKDITGRVVGSVFYGEMLRTMRESKIKGTFGHGGRGEEVFSAQLHDMLAERMGQSRGNGLADVLYDRFKHQQNLVGHLAARQGGTA